MFTDISVGYWGLHLILHTIPVWNESEYMHLWCIASMDTVYNGTLQVHQSSTSMSAFPLFIDEMPSRVQHFSIIQYPEHNDNHTKKWHEMCILLKGLRPVLKGLVATMHEGACKQEVQSRGRWSDGLDVLFTQARVHCHYKTRQFALIVFMIWLFVILPRGYYYSTLKRRMLCSKREPSRLLITLLRHAVPFNDEKCRLTMPVVKGRCA